MNYTRRFPKIEESVPQARAYVAKMLMQFPTDVVDRVVLMVSELMTNAIVHANSSAELAADVDTFGVRITVTDAGGGRPTPRTPSDFEAHGRGLRVVEALSDRWGIEYLPNSKSVWFSVQISETA